MVEALDIYGSVKSYERALIRFRDNELLSRENREVCLKWMESKYKNLLDGLSKEDIDKNKVRTAKTMIKYCILLTNVSFWFKDLRKITKKDLIQFKEDFNQDKIRSHTGKALKCKSDYYNKIFKSDFFKTYLKHRDIVEEVFSFKTKKEDTSVEFITLDDINKIISHCVFDYHKVIIYTIFSTGLRISEFLNLKKKDFELKYNTNTKIYYYLCHVRKEYAKSKMARTVPIVLPESIDTLRKYLDNKKNNDLLVDISYSGVRSFLIDVTDKAKIRSKPDNKRLKLHTLRKSCALYLLNTGYSLDQVKSYLGHRPSSSSIDVYVNYAGLNFEPEVSKVQTDVLIDMKKELEDNKLQMNVLQQQAEQQKKEMDEIRNMLKEYKEAIKFKEKFKIKI